MGLSYVHSYQLGSKATFSAEIGKCLLTEINVFMCDAMAVIHYPKSCERKYQARCHRLLGGRKSLRPFQSLVSHSICVSDESLCLRTARVAHHLFSLPPLPDQQST